ncbi:MAG: TonB-dependent receptor plug domain-containing protein, partial [Candidatus Amulumruptor sp.]|nr:TonB-dependent receptor plug domain-containing protein [Candidatus Amulumruptor sp.]
MKKLFLLLLAVVITTIAAVAQTRTVTGQVVAASDGEPLIGATVQPVGEGAAVATDVNGQFTIKVKSDVRKLKVSYVGMIAQIVDIQNTVMTIRMQSNETELDEVMVVAYGTAKKSSLTGAVSTISGGQIEKLSVSNVSKALEGAVPGVQVAMESGQPGTSATVRIRGIGSINSSSAPLYVVDGIPFQGEIASINPADIESMNVLKDAASTALYGARAANGVILITTKKGAQNRTKVTLDVRLGQNSRGISNYDIMTDPREYMKTYWLAQKNTLNDGAAASAQLFGDLGYNPFDCADNAIVDANGNVTTAPLLWNDSWEDEAIRKGFRQEYNLTVSGGTDRSNHFLSLGYLGDE